MPLVQTVATAVECGARAVVLREKDFARPARSGLADSLRAVLDPVDGLLIMAGAGSAGAVHLSASDAFPTPRPLLVGRSCHSADEVAAAAAQGCDYVTVSPVFGTPSKPGYGPPLGVDGLAALCRTGPPVYALGGLRPEDVRACLGAGARGVAVMGAVMRDPRLVAGYLEQMQQ